MEWPDGRPDGDAHRSFSVGNAMVLQVREAGACRCARPKVPCDVLAKARKVVAAFNVVWPKSAQIQIQICRYAGGVLRLAQAGTSEVDGWRSSDLQTTAHSFKKLKSQKFETLSIHVFAPTLYVTRKVNHTSVGLH